ncbi:hypothetical protein SK128_020577 [Halocaridina rubra]|uniref:Fe2OG dioxygenase domain-containing protein n=1 Tax=Halocaridina rubra TaxID=373956 RepID=A0AAN8XQG5_HALRR
MPASFWREIDGASSTPTYSWDHQALLDDKTSLKGYWHASCIRGVYAIRHDVLAILSDPYTHNVPNTDAHSDSDMAFCEALREEGIPMIATSAFPNSGILLNITNYKATDHNIAQYNSNPVMWTMTYVNRDIQKVISGEFGSVKRPCHEVYEIPVFNQLFAYDILDLAKRVNRWSPGHSFDQRKEFGIEPVPTVDQWFSQLGLKDVFAALNRDIFSYLQKMGYPFSNTGLIKLGLLARFQPNEISGLPLHHDSGIMTMYINLTPLDEYKGGEVEFPKQECKVRSKLGHLLLFPSRLTHPKILHNVTEGVLYKIMMYTKEITAEDINHNENDNH